MSYYFKEIMKRYSCFLFVKDWNLDWLIFHYDNIYLHQSFIYCLLAMPACQISFDFSLFTDKHITYKKDRKTHVIYYHLNFRGLWLVLSKICEQEKQQILILSFVFLDVQMYLIRLSSRLACTSNTGRLQMLVQNIVSWINLFCRLILCV
jgi:hypothetical protein